MIYLRNLFLALFLSLVFVGCSNSQTSVQPPTMTPVATTGATIESGVFVSKEGGFSIAIPEMPAQMFSSGSAKAKEKGVDTGKMFFWKFGRITYTISYMPAVDVDGNPEPASYEDMENGTRKGILRSDRSNAKLISEKPIKLGENRGTEFRYVSGEGIGAIGRIYQVGDVGFQINGVYADPNDEKVVLDVLNSFKLLKK